MALVTILAGDTQTISSSGTDQVAFVGLGTLNIAGTVSSPIAVTLSQVVGAGLLDNVNISNAQVTLSGAAVSALVNYDIGSGGLLDIASPVAVEAGTTFTFSGIDSRLTLGAGVDISLLGGVSGFGPGSSIDVAPLAGSLTYTDNPGADTGGSLVLRDASNTVVDTIPLTTGNFTDASFTLTPDGTGGTLIGFATTVTGVTAAPSTADLGAGQTAMLTVAVTDPVKVQGGTPTLTLNDGGTATYDAAASTSTTLVFTHTVAAGENTPDLAITAVSLNGATVTDAGDTPVDLTAAAVNPAGILQVDTTAPTATGITTAPGSGTLGVGQVVTLTVATSEPVTVTGGTPTLTLNDGGTATYAPGASTPTTLVFTTTVAPGENAADLSVTAVNPNGAAITDGAGNVADLSGAVASPPGVLTIDTTAPTATGVTTTPGSGMLGAGQTVSIMVATSEPVTVAGGTPTLTLSDGGTATYDPAASTPTALVFDTTVTPGENTPDLAVTAVNPNGATISDAAGNAADLSGAITNPAGVLAIDTTAPTITGVSTMPGSGALGAGQMVALTVATSEPVTVAGGTPTLTLSDGGTATYDPTASTPTALVFDTTVAAGQNSPDLTVTGLALNGATIMDGAGNAADLSGAAVNPAGVLAIDTMTPTVTGVTATPASGTLGVGQTATFMVATSEAVSVASGTPTLTLSDGGTATYDPTASTPTSLAFTTTVAPGQNTADLAVTAVNANGATIGDAAGNPADLSGAVTNPAGVLAVDTTAPTVTGVSATPASGTLGVGQTASIMVATSEPVTVTGGTPTLTLSDGGTATYAPGASTPTTLVFTTTVTPGENTADLAVTAVNPNGAAISDGAGNAADLSGAVTNPAGVLAVDTTAPTATGVTTTPGAGTLGAGQTVSIMVATSEPVTVAGGTPTLSLSDGGVATYDPAASTPTDLVFTTTVTPGENTPDLAVTAVNPNGATIADGAGNGADLSGAITNPPGVLAVDTTAPTITGVSTLPGSGALGAGQMVALTVATSEPVTVTGGTPTLTLSDGGTATYDPTASTPTGLVFDTTVTPGENTPDLAVTGLDANGATIADGAGNPLDTSGAAVNPPGTLAIDTTPPAVTTVTTNPPDGTVTTGQTIMVTVGTTEPVTVTGGPPTLSLSNGGTATYDPAASTPTSLVFDTTVMPGQDTGDLAITGLDLNGGTIADPAGNALDPSGIAVNPPGTLVVDTSYHPFTTLVASNSDPSAVVTVVVSTRPPIGGTYGNLGGGSIGADGTTYTVSGSAAAVTAALAGVTLRPAAGSPSESGLTASVSDDSPSVTTTLRDTGTAGSSLTAATAGDVVAAGSGPDTLLGGAAGTTLLGGPGNDVLVGSTGGGVVAGGTGSSTLFAEGGDTVITGQGAADVVSAQAGNVTVVSAAGGHTVVGLGAGSALVNGQGADTLIAGSGSLVAGVSTGSVVFLSQGDATISAAAGSTVVGGAGADTVGVRGSGLLFFAGSGPATFIGGTGDSTVVGGAGGNSFLFGGNGGGILNGGLAGNNYIVGGQQATTIFGGGSGDLLFAVGSSDTIIHAGAGNETLQGIGSSGTDTFFAGPGADLVGLGSGNDAVFGGSGAATVVAGAGADVFAFTNGMAGGTEQIVGFKPGVDVVSLQGYAPDEVARASASAVTTAGTATQAASTTVTLSDNTRITFDGFSGLPPRAFG